MSSLPLILAVLPFVLFLLLLFSNKLTLPKVALSVLGVEMVIQMIYWKILPIYLLNSVTKGFFVALDIFLIVFGVVFFLEVMREINVIENIGFYLESISKDYRVQVILLAWFFINFMEGMAGFGTPGAIVAPILVSIGLSPLTAVIVCLLGNSSAGAFGAVGTPIRVGFAGLNIVGVPWHAALFNTVGWLMPIFMIWVLAREQKEKKVHFMEVLPFAVWSGFLFVICSLATVIIGQEFVSVIGSLLAIILIVLSLRWGWFVPKTIRSLKNHMEVKMSLPLGKVLLPYLVVFSLLVAGKIWLKAVNIHFPWGYQYAFNFFNPGLIFFVASWPFVWGRKGVAREGMKTALQRTVNPFLVILAMSTMIQMMVNSGSNNSGLPSVLSLMVGSLNGQILPLVAPFVGALGAFVSGSVTISNILFGNILASASNLYRVSTAKILGLEIAGAAMGNTMALADIMAAEAVVGIGDRTRSVLWGTVIPCLICLTILGIVGLLFVR